MSLPAADDLFRPTTPAQPPVDSSADPLPGDAEGTPASERTPSGRVRHDEKMTVYLTAEELLDLEHARLSIRRTHGLTVDRGRLVRAALAIALADFEEYGDDSVLVQRLTQA